ncbi:MAG: L-carnitine dehydratase/bile acid-inducible protein [Frankiales bacterium]|jgi:alpha-methylacyl-CoA racemase|nr:L-carnitine dehydratase/bile acid-inducible protein [Frankiales bacterium]
MTTTSGPLAGTRVVELAGLGPGPFAAMLLADLGADVVRVDRTVPGGLVLGTGPRLDVVNRGKRSLAVDLKDPGARDLVLDLVAGSDVLIEGFRPGVAERLGLGPADCAARNPKLVYARMTGWGQEGPLAPVAGHDIDYLALTGALWATGRADEAPTAPLNLLGDYAGGSMFLVMGVLAALLEAERSGLGQVVDAAMVDGASVLTTMFTALSQMGVWDLGRRGSNPLDSGAPWYDVYPCADDRWVAVGALEPQFYAELVRLTGFREGEPDRFQQVPPEQWPALKAQWAALWKTRPRDEWAALLGGTDACVQPVLDWQEREEHPHLVARQTYVELDGITQPAPAPRLSRTPLGVDRPPPLPGEHTREVARELGLPDEVLEKLLASGALSVSS